MFFHFDFASYFRMLRLAWNEHNRLARRYFKRRHGARDPMCC